MTAQISLLCLCQSQILKYKFSDIIGWFMLAMLFMYSLLINHGLGLGVIDCCSMCHLWGESRHRWWLWARCLVTTAWCPHWHCPDTQESPWATLRPVPGLGCPQCPHSSRSHRTLSSVRCQSSQGSQGWNWSLPCSHRRGEEKNWVAGSFTLLSLAFMQYFFICHTLEPQLILICSTES